MGIEEKLGYNVLTTTLEKARGLGPQVEPLALSPLGSPAAPSR